ncbi:GIY-YIG nuclease family protein [Bacillus sp. JJ1773]|uniref:GIY-YIG nuclease family protein n=1 Tax=Bacillus sp. JJ1773 TaxID=3122965 RepID=UPI002FFDD358
MAFFHGLQIESYNTVRDFTQPAIDEEVLPPKYKIEGLVDILDKHEFFVWEKEKMFDLFEGKGKGIAKTEIKGIDKTGIGGTYFFVDNRGKYLYTGESDNLYRRICEEHVVGKKTLISKFFYKVIIFEIDHHRGRTDGLGSSIGLGYRKMLEDILNKKLKPAYWDGGWTKGNEDYAIEYEKDRRRVNWIKSERDKLLEAYKAYPTFKL